MDTPRHLQNLVCAEVLLRQHVAPAIHFVVEANVVDHDGIEPAHVQRALPRRRHREKKRLPLAAFQKGSDDANRFAAVVIGGIDPRRADLYMLRRRFYPATGRHEHRNPAPLPNDLLQKLVVEKLQRLFVDDTHRRGLGGVEIHDLENVRRVEVAPIERWIDGGG